MTPQTLMDVLKELHPMIAVRETNGKCGRNRVPQWKQLAIRERTKRGDATKRIVMELSTSYRTVQKYGYDPYK